MAKKDPHKYYLTFITSPDVKVYHITPTGIVEPTVLPNGDLSFKDKSVEIKSVEEVKSLVAKYSTEAAINEIFEKYKAVGFALCLYREHNETGKTESTIIAAYGEPPTEHSRRKS